MKRVIGLWVGFALLIWSWPAFAVPLLQLDIGGGSYSGSDPRYEDDTVVSSGDDFTLYALMHEKKNETSLKDDYFISIALYPRVNETSPPLSFGSFTFAGQTIGSATDMTYGNPGIPSHGVFDSSYTLYKYTLLLLGLGIISVAGYARRYQFLRVRSNPRFR